MDDATKADIETIRKWHAENYSALARRLASHLTKSAEEVEANPYKLSIELGDTEWRELKRRAAIIDMLHYMIRGPRF
jgi:hypothetical protein